MTEKDTLPQHVAIIMDGNGRWARKRGLPRNLGHKAGLDAARRIIEHCTERGVGALTLFTFSSENWRRPEGEVGRLMELFLGALGKDVRELHENGIRVRFVGARRAFSDKLQRGMAEAEELTAANPRMLLNIAVGYGGRWDIVEAARGFARKVAAGQAKPEDLDEQTLGAGLVLGGSPDPELFIRTGGERRISNFLLWNLAYSELYFSDVLWPDFDAAALDEAFAWYAARQRRFGLTGEQVEGEKGA
ncbi:MAG TPA: polyprenyl diphosphate synthase [Gammaproteobacteria bacterium]|nr:polyprenyl diphosphate synthase [Gammaproteobacteria bacterium]